MMAFVIYDTSFRALVEHRLRRNPFIVQNSIQLIFEDWISTGPYSRLND